MNKIGSNPLEHLFSLIRMSSKYTHTFEKMKKKLGLSELHKIMLNDIGYNKGISRRVTNYACTIENIGVNY